MIEEEVKEGGDDVVKQLFVEVFKDKDSFVENMVENLKKVGEVELEMTGGSKRTFSEMDDYSVNEPEDLDAKIGELLDKFEGKDLVYVTKFFKVFSRNSQPHLAVAHPRIQKKAADLSYPISFKGNPLKTDCAALTNLDSDVMSGRGNTGPVFCTLVPVKDLGESTRKRLYDRFNMEFDEDIEESTPEPSASQDFPYHQSQTEETIKVCQVCRFTTRDKVELKEHMKTHCQCETCWKHFATPSDLDHHMQDHKKETCSECNKEIRKDEMVTHKMNHLKLKSFGKKTLKEKSLKPVTGYGMWQSEERKLIVESNPSMNFNEVSSELGRRWKIVGKEMKETWKQKAIDYNTQLKTSNNEEKNDVNNEAEEARETPGRNHIDNLDIQEIPVPTLENTSSLNEMCPLCDFESDSGKKVAVHMKENHRMTQSNLFQCTVCNQIFISRRLLEYHMNNRHSTGLFEQDVEVIMNEPGSLEDIEVSTSKVVEPEDVVEDVVEPEVVGPDTPGHVGPREIVLVKSKKLSWPAEIQSRENDMVKVRMVSDDKIKIVQIGDIEEFDISKIANTKNSRLKQAFAKAVGLMKR